jgi:hypothetical protein
MAVTLTSNKKNTSLVIHVSSANSGNVIIAGNSSVSNVAVTNETLTGAYITQAYWGCDGNGHVQILRGATLVAVYDSTGYKDYAGCGMPLNVNQTANLTVNFVGSSNAYVIIEMQKVGTFTSDYFVG